MMVIQSNKELKYRMGSMKLHEAIEKVIKENGSTMTSIEIAYKINSNGLYRRKDGNSIPTSQIIARVNEYPNLFVKTENQIQLVEMLMPKDDKGLSTSLFNLMEELLNRLLFISSNSYIDSLVFVAELSLALNLFKNHSETKSIKKTLVVKDLIDYVEKINKDDYIYQGCFDGFLIKTSFFSDDLIKEIKTSMIGIIDDMPQGEAFKTIHEFAINSRFFRKSSSGQFLTPDFVNELIVSIANPSVNDIVYDPASGIGNTLLQAFKYNNEIEIFGQEIDQSILAICKLNLILNNCEDFKISLSNSITTPMVDVGKVDIIISTPPFSGRINDSHLPDFNRVSKSLNSEVVFLEMMLSRLNAENGKMAIVVPDRLFSNSKNYSLRKNIIDNDQLEAVISLPKDSFYPYSNVKTSIVVINNNKPGRHRGKVLFIDCQGSDSFRLLYRELKIDYFKLNKLIKAVLTAFHESIYNDPIIKCNIVGCEVIAGQEYRLNTGRYTSGVLELINEIAKKESLLLLKDVLIKRNGRGVVNVLEEIKYVQVKDLNDNAVDFYLNTGSLGTNENIHSGNKILNYSALLMARVGNKLKPTYFKFEGQPIFISANVLVYEVNTDIINIEYLISQLNSKFINAQLDLIQSGALTPSFPVHALLKIKIPVPLLSEQLDRLTDYKETQANKSKLTEFINDIKLVTNIGEIKNEVERFATKCFTHCNLLEFKTEFEFEKFPFTEKEIAETTYIKKSKDKHFTYLLLINNKKETNGVLIIDIDSDVSFEKYSEINAFTNFLINTSEEITRKIANDSLAKFAHTTKNFFLALKGEIDVFVSSKNEKIQDVLKKEYVESEAFIANKIKKGKNIEKYIAFNKLQELSSQISSIAKFYNTTDFNFKQIKDGQYSEFKIVDSIREHKEFVGEFEMEYPIDDIKVFAKKESVIQSIIDILQNAATYSTNGYRKIKIIEHLSFVSVIVENSITNIIPKETYELLGKQWLTRKESKTSSGLYWAFQAIEDSKGTITLLDYNTYRDDSRFQVIINLKKKL